MVQEWRCPARRDGTGRFPWTADSGGQQRENQSAGLHSRRLRRQCRGDVDDDPGCHPTPSAGRVRNGHLRRHHDYLFRGGDRSLRRDGLELHIGWRVLDASNQDPNKPDVVGFTRQFTSRPVYPDATHDNYGGRLSGWIVPPETANYEFFLRSDKAGPLYLSKDDKPETAVLIAEEFGRANQFLEPGDTVRQTSKPIALKAGQRYYIYALWKAGGGGDSFQRFDYCDVAWRKVGDPAFPVAQTLPYIPGTVLETYAAEGTFTPPSVSLACPAAGDSLDVGAPVKLMANAGAATNKTIVKVEYFESNQKIGEATRAPFALTLFDLRENPHADARASAIRAAHLLDRTVRTGQRPTMFFAHPPIVWPPTGTASNADPMRSLLTLARSLETRHLEFWAVNVAAGSSFADTPDTGLSFTIASTGPETQAPLPLN